MTAHYIISSAGHWNAVFPPCPENSNIGLWGKVPIQYIYIWMKHLPIVTDTRKTGMWDDSLRQQGTVKARIPARQADERRWPMMGKSRKNVKVPLPPGPSCWRLWWGDNSQQRWYETREVTFVSVIQPTPYAGYVHQLFRILQTFFGCYLSILGRFLRSFLDNGNCYCT